MTDLGPDWVPDDEGVPSRKGARLLIFDREGNILLIRGHDTHDLRHRWWFTVGGGVEQGEDPRAGALREAVEETGFCFDARFVEGPVMHRKAEFRFRNVIARQDELFFIARVDGVKPPVESQNLTALENETLDEFAWCSPAELKLLQGARRYTRCHYRNTCLRGTRNGTVFTWSWRPRAGSRKAG